MFCRFYLSAIVFLNSLTQFISITNVSPQIFETLKNINMEHKNFVSGPPERVSLAQIFLKKKFERVRGIEPLASACLPAND